MATETRKRYEETEREVERIACDECEKRWDSREKTGVVSLVLNAKPKKIKSRIRSTYHRDTDWGKQTPYSSRKFIIEYDDVIDLCTDMCYDNYFIRGTLDQIDRELQNPQIEVTDTEPDIEEYEEEEHFCDKCGNSMGDEVDHTVSIDPQIKVKKTQRRIRTPGEGSTRTEVYGFGTKTGSIRETDNYRAEVHIERDECFDICDECKIEIFDDRDPSKGLMYDFGKCFIGLCYEIRDITTLNRWRC